MTTTAISLPAVKLLSLVFGFHYLSVLKPLDAHEAGFLVHKHPFPALDLSLATSLWCCCLPRRVWKMRDCFKIFRSIHSTAGKLGEAQRRKEDRVDTLPWKQIRETYKRPILVGIKALVKAETKQLLFPKKCVVFVPWTFCFVKAFL